MNSRRYERVSRNDDDDNDDSPIERPSSAHSSLPPSFRSRNSSLPRHEITDQNLADTFDADGSDSDDENAGDDRQRLMRGSPPQNPSGPSPSAETTVSSPGNPPAPIERRVTTLPAFVPSASSGRVYGGGSGSDGVFANLSAKPEAGEKLEEHPPTYEQAAADAAPPYWETTILAPGLGGVDEVYVDGLPVGSVFSFVWNGIISMSFQVVGFLLTYLLHTTHAAKNGSLAGLGITLVQYGFYLKSVASAGKKPANSSDGDPPPDPNAHDFDPNNIVSSSSGASSSANTIGSIPMNELFAYLLMIVGWFVLIRAISSFLRARRHEQLVLQSPERGLTVPIIATGEGSETVV